MPDTTERPPAREVLSAAIQETLALGLKPEGSLFASKLLAALAAAGYPVQAGPALVEALEAAPVRPDASEDIYGIRQWFASYRDWKFKAEAALALAKQEPQP